MKQSYILPFLFVNLNMLNILDKFITILALKNVLAYEGNPIIRSAIINYGITNSLIMYMILSFLYTAVIYLVANHLSKRMKNFCSYTTPENFFVSLNILFYFVVINNIYTIVNSGGL